MGADKSNVGLTLACQLEISSSLTTLEKYVIKLSVYIDVNEMGCRLDFD